MSGSVKWGASPLSSAVNWLSKEVFGQRKLVSETAVSTPVVIVTPPPPPPPPPTGTTAAAKFNLPSNSQYLVVIPL